MFPNFSKLDIAHQEEFDRLSKDFEPYAEFSFPCLFCWDTDGSTQLSVLNGNLVIRMPDYITGEPFYSLIGTSMIDESMNQLLSITDSLKLVPEVTIDHIKRAENFVVTADRDQFDYIYSLDQLVNLPGAHFKGRRNKKGRFVKVYEDQLHISKIKFGSSETIPQLLNVFDRWAKQRGRSISEASHERLALSRLLTESTRFNLIGIVVEVDDEIVGFSINEIVQKNYAVCRFQKSLLDIDHLDAFLSNLVAVELKHYGCDLISWEQDLGIEGLRQFKESYKPVMFLKKYTVTK